jgi:hypothetical protein
MPLDYQTPPPPRPGYWGIPPWEWMVVAVGFAITGLYFFVMYLSKFQGWRVTLPT